MSTTTPSFTDPTTVVADGTLAKGSISSGTLNLAAKFGAWLFLAIGKGGTTGLSNGCAVLVRRTLNAGGTIHPCLPSRQQNTTTVNGNTTVNSTSNSGQNVLNVASVTNFAAGDVICIQDSGGGVTRLEFARVSKVSGSTLVLDDNLQYTHTAAQADTVRNKADVFTPLWLAGGCTWEVIFDNGAETTADNITIRAQAQTYNSDTTA
jgi:hypothetical protein